MELDEDGLPKKAEKYVADSKNLLRQQFNFYTFGVDLNIESSSEIINRVYNRLLEKSVYDSVLAVDAQKLELKSVRKMIDDFKKQEDESKKKIHELNMKYQMVKDEKAF